MRSKSNAAPCDDKARSAAGYAAGDGRSRGSIMRRDINDLVRDESGKLSPTKIGTLAGQWLAIKLILENGAVIILNWDSLMVIFSVLIAPEIFKKLLNMKYGNGHSNGAAKP